MGEIGTILRVYLGVLQFIIDLNSLFCKDLVPVLRNIENEPDKNTC